MINILIFEKDLYWQENLKLLPYKLTFANNEDDVFNLTYNKKFDFYIFDFENGYSIIKELKENDDETLTIFLSNIETFDAQKKAYKYGDDFFKKSLTYIEEIKIKIDYYVKKHFGFENVIRYNEIFYHTKLNLIYKNGKKIELTTLENELLILFFKNKQRYLSKDFLTDTLNIKHNSLKVKISQLRKIGFDIINQRELGYKIKEAK